MRTSGRNLRKVRRVWCTLIPTFKENRVSNNLVYIVQVDEARYVGVNPTGQIHIGWNRVTVHLEHHELRTLAQMLQESFSEEMLWAMEAEVAQAEELAAEEYGTVDEWDEFDDLEEFEDGEEIDDSVQVWLGDVALLMNMEDFELFMEMIFSAYELLEHGSKPPEKGHGTDLFFSLN